MSKKDSNKKIQKAVKRKDTKAVNRKKLHQVVRSLIEGDNLEGANEAFHEYLLDKSRIMMEGGNYEMEFTVDSKGDVQRGVGDAGDEEMDDYDEEGMDDMEGMDDEDMEGMDDEIDDAEEDQDRVAELEDELEDLKRRFDELVGDELEDEPHPDDIRDDVEGDDMDEEDMDYDDEDMEGGMDDYDEDNENCGRM